ncbi:MAG: 30S ribosomal protein S2 [Puniceicoccaceae bacterium]
MNITPKDLFEAGVHFGHQVRRWNPGFKPFVYDHLHGVSIIDLEKTYIQLELASKFLFDLVASGKSVLFVGTKKQAQEIVRETANLCGMPFCANRWMGGTLTNFATIKQSLAKYRRFLQMETDGSLDKLPKKEGAAIRRQMQRMNRNFEGLINTNELPAALVIVDGKSEEIAVAEAAKIGIPVVALVDTNTDPSNIQYPIPGNDDAAKSIRILLDVLSEAIQSGLENRSGGASVQKSITPLVAYPDIATNDDMEVTLPVGYNLDEEPSEQALSELFSLSRKPPRSNS